MSRYMNLTVIEVQGPDRILARETPGPTASAETVEYASFFKEMNDYFNNNILTFEIHSPKPNEICAACHSHNNKWHRVRVQTILSTMRGAKADCLFLDTGERRMVKIEKIQKIPQKFLTLPFQVKTFALCGLCPLSLVIEASMKAYKRPCKKWDKSATNHIKKMIKNASAIEAVIKSKGEENVLFAMIYLRFSGKKEILSLNDDMVNHGYAIKDAENIKSFDDETDNFLPDVLQNKYVDRVLSQKPEQPECSVYNLNSTSLNGFHRNPRANNCPVRVRLTSPSNIPLVNSSDDDSGDRSSSSSGTQKNNSLIFSMEQNSCTDSKNCRKIPSNISSDTPFTPPDNQQMASRPSNLKQLLNYHKMLQQNHKVERKSEPLNSQLQNLGKDSFPAASKNCNLDLPAPSLQSSSSSHMTKNSKKFHDFKEERRENPISTVISPNCSPEVISKVSPVKSPQTSPAVASSKSKTGSALSDFLAYHKKIASGDPESVPDLVTFKTPDHSSNMSAKDVESTDDKKNKSENAFPVSDCQKIRSVKKHEKKSVHNDKCDSKKLSGCKLSEPFVCQSSLVQKSSPVTDNSNNSSSFHCYEAKSNVPFSGIQTKPDDKECNRNYKETTLDTFIKNHCSSEKTISPESPNCRSHPSNSAFKETIPGLSKISSSAVNVLNHLVSSKLHSSSSCNPMQMLQSLNNLTLNKLENSGNSSTASGFSKNNQILSSADESDFTQTDDQPCLSTISSCYPGKQSYENFKNELEKLESQARTDVESANSTTLLISSPEPLDYGSARSSFIQEETLSPFKSQTKSLQAHAAAEEWNPVFEDKRKIPSKIESLFEINDITPEQHLPEIANTKTNKQGDTFMDESKKEHDDSFELLTVNENDCDKSYVSSSDLSFKDCIDASDAEFFQENKIKDILPLIASENEKNNHSAINSQTVEKENEDCFSLVDIPSKSDLKTTSNSTSSSSVADSKDVVFSSSVDIENTPIICEDNTESTSILNENLESPSTSTNDDAETLGLEDNKEPVSLLVPHMPALIDITDSDSKSTSPAKDPKIESTSSSMTDLTDVTSETNMQPLSALSTSQSSITGPNEITKSEASSEKLISDTTTQHIPSSPPPSTNDCIISSLLSTNNENKEFEYVTSTDKVPLDNNPDSIVPQAFSVPEISNGSSPLLLPVTDVEVSLPESINSMLTSESALANLDNNLNTEQCSFDQDENNDLCSDEPHTISNGNTKYITSEDNELTTSASNIKPNTIPGSLACQGSSEETNAKKLPTCSEEKSLNARDNAMDYIRGRSLLEKLGVGKKVKKGQPNWMESITTESILLNDSVLFLAEKIPNPIYDLKGFDVPEVLSQSVNLDIQPKPIQAYSWGPAIRGKNVIGVSPQDSGKTWAYLVPIFTSLCQYNLYSDIKFSNGPFVLILVQSWKRAISVYEQCRHMNRNKEINIEVGYGGGEEKKKTVKLLNGCHVLIATLPCLQRMLDSKFTNLDRLCHLVIDDADILLQDFYKEIVDLMCKYKSVVECRDQGYQRHQVMTFSSKWTSYLDGFVKNAIQDPVIVITDMIEAAVYGRVKQIPIMCEDSKRKDQLVKLIPQITKPGEKIIIFALDEECFELQRLLCQLLQKHVAMVCDSLYKSEWEIVSKEWKLPLTEKESYRVFVCSDVVFCDLFINDATCVVQYQMPKRKVHVGLRMQAMSNYYQHYDNMIEDLDPEKELCRNVKSFGKCRNRYKCHYRHSVVPSVDLNGACSLHICLPLKGDVRVKILHVKSANNFYVRILEHQIGTQKSIQVHSDLSSLVMGMAIHYSNPSNKKTLDNLTVGMLCAVKTSENFSRVKILQAFDNDSKNAALVFFVDTGNEETHPICNLYELADEFKEVPFQAVEVFLCSLYPVDFDTEWTPFANSFAESWLESKILYGKIRFVMDNTLWLDPLLERTFLKSIKTVANGPSLSKELIKNNLAINNPQHLIQLHKLFEGYVPKLIPTCTVPTNCSTWEFNLENETLQTGDDYENVLISYIFNPEHFFVQKLDMKVSLNDLMTKIQEKIGQETGPQQKREWFPGMHCLSKSSVDSRWYRVIILSILDSKAVIHFVDYGDIEEVCIDELQTMPRELMYLPSQAIECKLAHIKSSEDQWSAKCNDMMYYMSQTGDSVYKTLAVNVVCEIPTEGKLPQYSVNLLDTSYEKVINFGQELVWWKMAVPADDHFKPLFSKPVTAKMFYPTAAKIAEMCAVLYYEQASSKQYADLMISYLKASIKDPEKLIEEDVPGCLLKLLSFTHSVEVFSLIVDCIKLLVSSPSLFDNLLSYGIIQSLGQILRMHDDVSILQMTLQLIRFMTEIKSSLIGTIASLESGLFSIMCEIIKSVYPNEIKIFVCQLLESYCLADQKCTENLLTLKVCPLFLPHMPETEDHDFTEAYLSLLDPVSLLDSGLVEIKREGPIEEIMKIVKEAKCEKCVCNCLIALKRLADKSRKNKTLLLEQNAIAIFSSCQNLLNGTVAANLCQELLDGLFVKVDQDNKVTVSSQLLPMNENNFQILWCQNKFRILITVKIKNSEWSGCEFQKTAIQFSFAPSDDVVQSMKYELFDELIVEKCAVSVQNNEVILSLCKAEVKHWPRLLQDKYNKPRNLFVDFDKIEDSDDSDSEEEVEANEENLFTLQVVPKRLGFDLVKRLTDEEENVPLPVDSAKSDEDSLENSDFEEYDRFNIFNTKYT